MAMKPPKQQAWAESDSGGAAAAVIGQPAQETMPMMKGGEIFNNLKSVFIIQEFAAIEMCGIEAKNRYRISPSKDQPSFLYAMESSACFERICCPGCRKLTMNLHQGSDKSGPVVLSMDKKCHCPMMPCPALLNPGGWPIMCPWVCIASQMPPEFMVREGGAVIGSVFDPPWPLFGCKINSLIRDASGNEIMRTGPVCMCQKGLVCPCCADMPIGVFKGEKQVATITRISLSCMQMCCTKTNNIQIDFDQVTDATEKKLVFAAAMLLDLQYFEQKE